MFIIWKLPWQNAGSPDQRPSFLHNLLGDPIKVKHWLHLIEQTDPDWKFSVQETSPFAGSWKGLHVTPVYKHYRKLRNYFISF